MNNYRLVRDIIFLIGNIINIFLAKLFIQKLPYSKAKLISNIFIVISSVFIVMALLDLLFV